MTGEIRDSHGRSARRSASDLDPNADPEFAWLRTASPKDLRAFASERVVARPVWTVVSVLLALAALPALGLVTQAIVALLARDYRALLYLMPFLAMVGVPIGVALWRFRVSIRIEEMALARMARREICVRCRYEFTGLRSDVCPECGLAIPISDASTAG